MQKKKIQNVPALDDRSDTTHRMCVCVCVFLVPIVVPRSNLVLSIHTDTHTNTKYKSFVFFFLLKTYKPCNLHSTRSSPELVFSQTIFFFLPTVLGRRIDTVHLFFLTRGVFCYFSSSEVEQHLGGYKVNDHCSSLLQ